MFKFSKNKNKDTKVAKPVAPVVKKTKLKSDDINVMPSRFYVVPKNNSGKNLKIIIIIIAVVVIIGGLAVFFSIDWAARSQPEVTQPVQGGEDKTSEEDTGKDTEEVVELIEEEAPDETEEEPIPEEEEEEPNYDAEEILEEEDDTEFNGEIATGPDADGDGLTDAEEILYGSMSDKPDTDADGYLDGQEVRGGFHPTVVKIALEESDLVTRYENMSFKYSILYPTAWSLRAVDDVGAQILFQPEESREFIEVIVVSNIPSLPRWYKEYVTPGSSDEPVVTSLNGWQVIASEDGLTFYFGRRGYDKVYILNYNFAGVEEVNYQATFVMIVNSFTFIEAEN